jgi:uncharacterized membrane protein
MAWNRRYSFLSYIRASLWIVPVLSLISSVVLKRVAENVGDWMARNGVYDVQNGFYALSASEAHAVLDRIFNVNVSCLVFTFGSLLVAIQVAGGQYTPRVIGTTLLRDNVIRGIVGLFIFTMFWANRAMLQLGNELQVPQLQVFLSMMFGIAAIVAFIYLIDYCAKLLRPVSLVARIGEQGIAVIERVYPHRLNRDNGQSTSAQKDSVGFTEERGGVARAKQGVKPPPDRVIYHQGKSGIVLALNLPALVAEAQRAECVVEFMSQVGNFVAVDEPLFTLYGKADAIDELRFRTLVAFGSERTLEQDPMFAFRIEVDIALKALSPAINDPTTAVLAIDQLHRLLRMVGLRALRGHEISDSKGRLRVIFHTPNWEDYVHITFEEIRQYGAGSLQVARRMRAMIENLIQTLPEHRGAALREELRLLDLALANYHKFPEDLALARIPDPQGLGGASQ